MVYALILVLVLLVLSGALLFKNRHSLLLPKWIKIFLLLLYLLWLVLTMYGILFVLFFGLNLP